LVGGEGEDTAKQWKGIANSGLEKCVIKKVLEDAEGGVKGTMGRTEKHPCTGGTAWRSVTDNVQSHEANPGLLFALKEKCDSGKKTGSGIGT